MNSQVFKLSTVFTLLLLFLGNTSAWAKKQDFQKDYSQSFKVGSSPAIEVECSFADVQFIPGPAGAIDVSVTVNVEASSEEKAEKRFDSIEVKLIQKGDRIEVETSIGSGKDSWNKTSFDIDVTILAPKNTFIDANTSFGDVRIDEIDGPVELECDYGDLRINKVGTADNKINVSFGGLWIGDFGGGDVSVEFGDGEIEKLRGDCDLSNSYGDVDVDWVLPECNRMKIACSFGDTKVSLDPDCNMSIEGSASMGDVKLGSGITINRESSDWNSEEYEASIGSGSGKMNIDCSFGDVKISVR